MEHFDERIKKSLEGIEMPYDAAAWQQMAQRLDASPATQTPHSRLRNWSIGLGGMAAVAGLVWFTANQDTPVLKDSDTEVAVAQQATTISNIGAMEPMVGSPRNQNAPTIADDKARDADETFNDQTSIPTSQPTEREIESTPEVSPAAEIKQEIKRNDTHPSAPRPVRGDVDEEIMAVFEVNKTHLCAGEELVLINQTAVKGRATQFHWEFGDGATSDAREPHHVYERPGRYTLSLVAGLNGKTDTRDIDVSPTPDVSLKNENLVGPAVPYYQFSTSLNAGETAHWSFGDGGTATGEEVKRLFRSTSDAKVTLTVRNQYGCNVTHESTGLYSGNFNLLAASAFSPTETSVGNDSYMPESLRELGIPFTFVVVDMKGNTVFTSKDVNNPWIGQTLSGEVLPRGIYKWQVTLGSDIVRNRLFTGLVTLK